jgi:hypothetical protein
MRNVKYIRRWYYTTVIGCIHVQHSLALQCRVKGASKLFILKRAVMQHTTITETDAIKACYHTIYSFFDVFDLPSARKHILQSVLAANSPKLWKGRCPADLIFFYTEFKKLLMAAVAVAQCGCLKEQAIINRQDKHDTLDIQHYDLYCGPLDREAAWQYIPKYLSIKEFYNPYKALKKAERYLRQRTTDDVLGEIIQYALSYDSYMEAGVEEDTLRLNMMLQKMVEAAYLVRVRTTNNEALVVDNGELTMMNEEL